MPRGGLQLPDRRGLFGCHVGVPPGALWQRDRPCLWPVGPHRGVLELPCDGGYRVFYEIRFDTGRDQTAGDVRVLRVFGPGQDRGTI